MRSSAAWTHEPFFDPPEGVSIDGGTTNQGPLWHAVTPRWGHSMHKMCSYHGMFPAKLAHYFLQRYSSPGDVVLDPFSGRGTTTLQARVEGRIAIGNDLNPLGFVLTAAKSNPPSWDRIMQFVDRLERSYRASKESEPDVPADISMLFHPRTLRQIVYLREKVIGAGWTPESLMVAGSMAGILHGAHRADGTSAYLSISMPNTFSMSPAYVRKFIAEKGLTQPDQDVFARLRDKIARLYLDANEGPQGRSHRQDAVRFMNGRQSVAGSVNLLVTSPPYMQVVNYGTANWIRLWWLGLDDVGRQRGSGRVSLDAKLDHQHRYDAYRAFVLRTLRAAARVLRTDGVAVFVIGDVTHPERETIPLAQQIWDEVGAKTGLELIDLVEDSLPSQNKVSRIWGDTKGQATDRDCVLVLTPSGGKPRIRVDAMDWTESYKDAGPDAAHVRSKHGPASTGAPQSA